ncbi:MAG: hypothetical protein JST80_09045 [Bdellovibrionales bacterium]|nr:hypothetical protein [Bdellovibrionales bacterium]
MDFSRFHYGRSLLASIRQKLSPHRDDDQASTPDPQKLKILHGGCLVAISLVLAWFTQQSVAEQSVLEHLSGHWPSRQVWDGSLQKLGFQLQKDSNLKFKIAQTLVPTLGAKPGIWLSDDHCLIYLTASPLNTSSELWNCTPTPNPPKRWIYLGSGLLGFQKIPSAPVKTHKNSNTFDPMEIRY